MLVEVNLGCAEEQGHPVGIDRHGRAVGDGRIRKALPPALRYVEGQELLSGIGIENEEIAADRVHGDDRAARSEERRVGKECRL